MSISLHQAVIQTYQQMLPQVAGFIDKAEAHCSEAVLEASALTEASLAPDMWPFAKQVSQCGHHSARAIEAVRAGLFAPEPGPVASDFASLRAEIEGARQIVDAVQPDELDAIAARDMLFKFGTHEMPFTVADFLLSFSLPNFYFHVSAAYGVLRSQGVKVGKMDYLGRPRLKV